MSFKFKKIVDKRGILAAFSLRSFPFKVKRFFFVYNVPSNKWRGQHAHKRAKQILICVEGSIKIQCLYKNVSSNRLLKSGQWLLLKPRTWCRYAFKSHNTLLLVCSDREFETNDYIIDKTKV